MYVIPLNSSLKDILAQMLTHFTQLIKQLTHEIPLPFNKAKLSASIFLVDTALENSRSIILDVLVSQLLDENGLIVLLDTTYSWAGNSVKLSTLKSKITTDQLSRLTIHSQAANIGSLMKTLRDISTGEFFHNKDHKQLPVKCVVIDNISIFRPQTEMEHTTREEYMALGSELLKLQSQIGCSILVKSWDRGFSSGVVKRLPLETSQKDPPSYWTGIPHEFTHLFEDVYFLQRSRDGKISGKYFERCSQTSVLIDKGVIHG